MWLCEGSEKKSVGSNSKYQNKCRVKRKYFNGRGEVGAPSGNFLFKTNDLYSTSHSF